MDEVKKIYKKRKRFAARLKSSKGIVFCEEPSANIVLCNVGQATGFEKANVLELLKDLPNVELAKFIAEKGESHCYIVLNSIEGAKLFFDACNGKEKVNGTPIYMNYVENVPNTEIICTSEIPNGLTLITDFITECEEKELLNIFDWIDESNLKNRQVKHYGYEFRYGSNDVDLSTPLQEKIPTKCEELWERLQDNGIDFDIPDQLTVNKYLPGQGIPSHVDRHSPFGNTILSLSLGSAVVMEWKHHSGLYVPLVIPPRSLLVMQGEARYDWQHGIQPRAWDPIIEERQVESSKVRVITNDTVARQMRISLTFRKTRQGDCDCDYKALCDRNNASNGDKMDDIASKLEELHVHQVYEQIAGHFSSTRHKPWPKVVEFLQSTPPGSIVLDLGAGNGKNILKRNDILQIAGERSIGLLKECKEHTSDVGSTDCVRLDLLAPCLRERCADVVICIAVIHHFSSQTRRRQAVTTIARLLSPGGRALITVWAKDQTKSNYLSQNKENHDTSLYSVAGVNLPIHENRTQFKHNDLLVPWKLRQMKEKKLENESNTTLLRYYHVFEENELDRLCDLSDLVVEKSFYEEGNWCVICRKI